MKVKIDTDNCIGCGLCTQIAPVVFKMEDDLAVVIDEVVPAGEVDNVEESLESCPTEAILVIVDG